MNLPKFHTKQMQHSPSVLHSRKLYFYLLIWRTLMHPNPIILQQIHPQKAHYTFDLYIFPIALCVTRPIGTSPTIPPGPRGFIYLYFPKCQHDKRDMGEREFRKCMPPGSEYAEEVTMSFIQHFGLQRKRQQHFNFNASDFIPFRKYSQSAIHKTSFLRAS